MGANIYLNIILLCCALIPDQTCTCTTQLATTNTSYLAEKKAMCRTFSDGDCLSRSRNSRTYAAFQPVS